MDQDSGDAVRNQIVSVKNLEFSYQIRNATAKSLKQTVINLLKGVKSDIHIHALKEIDFELFAGDVLGVIGNNGAGKSTLLKLIAGILPPSSGSIHVKGCTAPLIELGAGFNPELTGAENIVLFGVLLGKKKKHMETKVKQISEWAGLTESIHLPVRTYSTGMLSRLGFAVATFERSDLLIVDEVLSVGDMDFQLKSVQRMEELMSKGEVSILVSHDLNLIQERANKVIWLENGRQTMFGEASEVIDEYRKR
jgi:ABC-type polysaccharide/polyol phosphate transport system ATPase subunit